jgi:hypothetical protein
MNKTFSLPNSRIAWMNPQLANAFGSNNALVQSFAGTGTDGPSVLFPSGLQGAVKGLRTLRGDTLILQTTDILAVSTNVTTHDTAPSDGLPWQVYAQMTINPPTGADLIVEVYKNGTLWCTLTVPNGTSISQGISGASLPEVIGGDAFTANVTQVGSTFEGEGLRIKIQF